jgi:hypothetical protein
MNDHTDTPEPEPDALDRFAALVERDPVERFAALVLDQRRARLRADYANTGSDQAEWETVNVHRGPKYTRVDVGPRHNISGKYMIDNATGEIFGIKGYGRIHRGHQYGTLDTIDAWDWSGYVGRKRDEANQ